MISISDAVLVVAKGAHWRKSISLIPSFDAKGLTFLGAVSLPYHPCLLGLFELILPFSSSFAQRTLLSPCKHHVE